MNSLITFHVQVHEKPIVVSRNPQHQTAKAWATTFCRISVDGVVKEGSTNCSTRDKYDHKKGIRLAFERAVAQFPREVRMELWGRFFAQTGLEPTIMDKIQLREEEREAWKLEMARERFHKSLPRATR